MSCHGRHAFVCVCSQAACILLALFSKQRPLSVQLHSRHRAHKLISMRLSRPGGEGARYLRVGGVCKDRVELFNTLHNFEALLIAGTLLGVSSWSPVHTDSAACCCQSCHCPNPLICARTQQLLAARVALHSCDSHHKTCDCIAC